MENQSKIPYMDDPFTAHEVASAIHSGQKRSRFYRYLIVAVLCLAVFMFGGWLATGDGNSSIRSSIDNMCQRGADIWMNVGDTSSIHGHFIECHYDYVVLQGTDGIGKQQFRWTVRTDAIKMWREVTNEP